MNEIELEKVINKLEKVYYETFVVEQFPQFVDVLEEENLSEDELFLFIDGVISTLCLLFDLSPEKVISDIRLELSLQDAL